jgi:hypothetical protein
MHDHGLIWIKYVIRFGKSMNEEIEKNVDKYLTIDQIVLQKYIHNAQIHQHKQTCKKKNNKFVDFNILNYRCNLQKYCYFNKEIHTPNLCIIVI